MNLHPSDRNARPNPVPQQRKHESPRAAAHIFDLDTARTWDDFLATLCRDDAPRERGVHIRCERVSGIAGGPRSAVLRAPTGARTLDWGVMRDVTPMLYELIGYLAPGVRYGDIADLSECCTLVRAVDRQRGRGERGDTLGCPLYAMNLVKLDHDGRWRDIDHERAGAVSPMLQVLSIAPGQRVRIGGHHVALDEIDLGKINVFEATRLSSLAELVFAERDLTPQSGAPASMGELLRAVGSYRADKEIFRAKLREAKAVFGLAFAACAYLNNIDLLIGSFVPGVVDQFALDVAGAGADRQAFGVLEVSRYHRGSDAYRMNRNYFERHRVCAFYADARAVLAPIVERSLEVLSGRDLH
jgi:hypothetical protein